MVLKPSGRITRIAFGITTELRGREIEKKREGIVKERDTFRERRDTEKEEREYLTPLF